MTLEELACRPDLLELKSSNEGVEEASTKIGARKFLGFELERIGENREIEKDREVRKRECEGM